VQAAGLQPRQLTVEVTEQQAVSDVGPLKRQARALRKLGFGFAVDDAGAGYASFTLVAALRPSIIKIDREIVRGVRRDGAKQALVEAFVSFGRRIDAQLVAEGIERRHDLETLIELGVPVGQGFLLGRPAFEPEPPRKLPRRVVATLTGAAAAAEERVGVLETSIRRSALPSRQAPDPARRAARQPPGAPGGAPAAAFHVLAYHPPVSEPARAAAMAADR